MANRTAATLEAAGAIDPESTGPHDAGFNTLGRTQRAAGGRDSAALGSQIRQAQPGAVVLPYTVVRPVELEEKPSEEAQPREPPTAGGSLYEQFRDSLGSVLTVWPLLLASSKTSTQARPENGDLWKSPALYGPELGADATPAPRPALPRSVELEKMLKATRPMAKAAVFDAVTKLVTTGATASNAEEVGEGIGGAFGSAAGAVIGAVGAKYFGRNGELASMATGFAGEKLFGYLGKQWMAAPPADGKGNAPVASTSAAEQWASSVVALSGVAAVTTAYQQRTRLAGVVKGWLGKGGSNAGAWHLPQGYRTRPDFLARLGQAARHVGKVPVIEAGLKAAYTAYDAKTPEQKWAGYGGAIGGLVGGVVGTAVSPGLGSYIGSAIGDKTGGAIGSLIAKYLVTGSRKPLPAVSLLRADHPPAAQVLDKDIGTRTARRMLGMASPGQLPGAGARSDAPDALRQPAEAVPAAQPGQQLIFTANMPITVQGSVDAPNQLAQQLEQTVRRVMLDLHRQAYSAQHADQPQPF